MLALSHDAWLAIGLSFKVSLVATLARPDGRTFDQDPARYEEF